MKLAVSNIAWESGQDEAVYAMMQAYGFTGLEIAPTRIFPQHPYENTDQAAYWAAKLMEHYGFEAVSMQSIWYGRKERLFGTNRERQELIRYTKKAVDFAQAAGCKNLVFGCPSNRYLPEGADLKCAVSFFHEIGEYAKEHGTVFGLEANPPIYHTNYINDTPSALAVIRQTGSAGLRLNLDTGTMIWNGEDIRLLEGNVHLISHVHISEPFLKTIEKRKIHLELRKVLEEEGYQNFISIEMGKMDVEGKAERLNELEKCMQYVCEVFG